LAFACFFGSAGALGETAGEEDVAPDASAAAAAPRSWLRESGSAQTASVAAPPERPFVGSALAIALAVGLGLVALVARRRRPLPPVPESATRIRVLSTARIGPKANAVVAEIGGRVLLLGVTDTNVARLAVLHDEPPGPLAAPEPALPPRSAPVETADDGVPGLPKSLSSRFGEVLDRALGVKPRTDEDFRANPGVAALLAAGVSDVVTAPTLIAHESRHDAPVEAQAAGLALRRRRA
jgi:flagellar biogenesis protein FliO